VTLAGCGRKRSRFAQRAGVDPAAGVREVHAGRHRCEPCPRSVRRRAHDYARFSRNGNRTRAFYHKDLNLVLGMAHELGVPGARARCSNAAADQTRWSAAAAAGRIFSRMIEVLERAMTDPGDQGMSLTYHEPATPAAAPVASLPCPASSPKNDRESEPPVQPTWSFSISRIRWPPGPTKPQGAPQL